MTLYPIESGNFKLDGGAMFGVVPKTIWQKSYLERVIIKGYEKYLVFVRNVSN